MWWSAKVALIFKMKEGTSKKMVHKGSLWTTPQDPRCTNAFAQILLPLWVNAGEKKYDFLYLDDPWCISFLLLFTLHPIWNYYNRFIIKHRKGNTSKLTFRMIQNYFLEISYKIKTLKHIYIWIFYFWCFYRSFWMKQHYYWL